MKILILALILGLMGYWVYQKYPERFSGAQKLVEQVSSAVSEDTTAPATTDEAVTPSQPPSALDTTTSPPVASAVSSDSSPASADPASQPPAPSKSGELYLTERASQVTDQGVAAIPKGAKVTVVSRNGSQAIVTNGSVTLMVEESMLTTTPPETEVAATTSAAVTTKPSTSATKNNTPQMTEREKYFAQLRAQEEAAVRQREHNKRIYSQINAVQMQIDQLNSTMANMSQQTRARYRRQLEDLEKQRSALQAQIR